ncbi:MAG: hypothetical protein ABSE18_01620 [Minisyncoccia bacterium]|jgi:hypothetical protein
MKAFFRRYPEITLAVFAIVFLAIIVAYFIWGIGDVVAGVNRAVQANVPVGANTSFNLEGAEALHLPGLAKPQ